MLHLHAAVCTLNPMRMPVPRARLAGQRRAAQPLSPRGAHAPGPTADALGVMELEVASAPIACGDHSCVICDVVAHKLLLPEGSAGRPATGSTGGEDAHAGGGRPLYTAYLRAGGWL